MKPLGVIITDTHKDKDNYEIVIDIFKQAIDYCVKIECDNLFHAGDFFTLRTGQTLKTLLALKKVLRYAKKKGIDIKAIPGNHDKTDLDSKESYLEVYDDVDNFTIYNEEYIEMIDKNTSLAFLPYFKESYSERLKKIRLSPEYKNSKVRILITHKAFNGVRNNDGSIVTDGVAPEEVKGFTSVFVGHYHDQSVVGKNIFYIGASRQANFGENSEDKGFTVIYPDGSRKFVKSKFKKYIKIEVDLNDKSSIDNELERVKDMDAHIRFIFKGSRVDFDSLILSKFTDLGIDTKFESTEEKEEMLKVEGQSFNIFDKKSIAKNFLDFCKIQEIPNDKRTSGLKFLKEAS